MIAPRPLECVLMFGLGPIGQELPSKLLKLFDRHRLSLIRRGPLGHRLIHLIGYLLQPPIRMRPIGEAFIQTFFTTAWFVQFIVHELLYLYTFRACTISKLRIF